MVEVENQEIRKHLGEFYPFQSHYLEIDGHFLHYIDEGPKEAPVLLMIHGNPSWSIYWRRLIERYRTQFRVIAVDHIGCGLSDKPQDYEYTLANHIHNVSELVDHLNLSKVTFLLHDWGGAIGMGLAAERKGLVKSFVIFNSAAFYSPNIPKRIAVCRWPVFGKIAIQGFNAFAGSAVFMATEKGFSKELRQAYVAPYNSFRNRIATYKFVQDIPMEAHHPTRPVINWIEGQLGSFKEHPTLIIWGGKDWCFDDSFLSTWKEKLPQSEILRIADSGHYVVEDGYHQYADRLDQFLQSNGLDPELSS
ncbi:MAG: alpha/beta fold hydrolase [Bdellovibrionales bacterium]|nr:alpha/beta fold hydrolase [Bdellovibrionales bacterium]